MDNKSQVLLTKLDLNEGLSRLDKRISDSKVDMIKWIFAFWVTLVIMILGLYFQISHLK